MCCFLITGTCTVDASTVVKPMREMHHQSSDMVPLPARLQLPSFLWLFWVWGNKAVEEYIEYGCRIRYVCHAMYLHFGPWFHKKSPLNILYSENEIRVGIRPACHFRWWRYSRRTFPRRQVSVRVYCLWFHTKARWSVLCTFTYEDNVNVLTMLMLKLCLWCDVTDSSIWFSDRIVKGYVLMFLVSGRPWFGMAEVHLVGQFIGASKFPNQSLFCNFGAHAGVVHVLCDQIIK